VLGEGAGMLVLESLSHARQRDATVYAIAAGAGYSSDAYHIAHPAPDGAGVVAAITRAMADAQVDPGQVVHVNAHATSTPEGDATEAQALAKSLGSAIDGVVVTSTKSMTGHLLGGAGAVESVAAILALRERRRTGPRVLGSTGHRRPRPSLWRQIAATGGAALSDSRLRRLAS